MLNSKTVLTAVVGFAFVALLLACANAKAQTTSTPDSHWAPILISSSGDPALPWKTRCGRLQDFSKDAERSEWDGILVQQRGDAVKESVETKQVGEIMGFAIYEVLFHMDYPPDDPTAPAFNGVVTDRFPTFIKMILVQRKPEEYCEIFNEQGWESDVLEHDDPYMMNVESQPVLATRDPLRGNGGPYAEAYWTFDKSGPVPLDTNIIREIADYTVPSGLVRFWDGTFDWGRSTYTCVYRSVDDPTDRHTVTIKFALKDHKLVVVDKEFE